jgi:hypothetical protein
MATMQCCLNKAYRRCTVAASHVNLKQMLTSQEFCLAKILGLVYDLATFGKRFVNQGWFVDVVAIYSDNPYKWTAHMYLSRLFWWQPWSCIALIYMPRLLA